MTGVLRGNNAKRRQKAVERSRTSRVPEGQGQARTPPIGPREQQPSAGQDQGSTSAHLGERADHGFTVIQVSVGAVGHGVVVHDGRVGHAEHSERQGHHEAGAILAWNRFGQREAGVQGSNKEDPARGPEDVPLQRASILAV